MSRDEENARAATHLSRLGVNPVSIQRLIGYAEADGITLRELVRFVLTDYAPPAEIEEDAE